MVDGEIVFIVWDEEGKNSYCFKDGIYYYDAECKRRLYEEDMERLTGDDHTKLTK